MRISDAEILHCNAGWRDFSFLKLRTDEGLHGIAEFNECYGSFGLSKVIECLVADIKGENALAHEFITQMLYARTRQAPGGINAQAIAAIENALLDIKGKALNVPVYEIIGRCSAPDFGVVLVALRNLSPESAISRCDGA